MSGFLGDPEVNERGGGEPAPWAERAAGGRADEVVSSARAVAVVVAGAYVVAAGLWILLSDRLLAALLPHNETTDDVTKLQTFKGWIFVATTGALLYALVHWGGRRLRSGRRAVERSEALFRGVVESNAVAICVYHSDGRVLRANEAFLDLVGYTRADLQAGLLEWRRMTPEEFHGRENAACQQAVARGARSDPYEKQYIRKDGRRVPVLVTLAPLPGDPRFGVAAVVDLTQRKRAEEQAAQLHEALTEASRLKDEFLAMLSHELRTPITAIRLWTDLLRANGRNDPELFDESLANIVHGVDAQTRLINELLDLSRITSGRLHIERTPTDLRRIVHAAAEAFAPAAKEQGVSLEIQPEGITGDDTAPLQVSGDAGRLRQVAWNLIDNAIKFTPNGGRVTIDVHVKPGPVGTTGRAALSIIDTGDGLPPEFMRHLFEPFRQADSSTTRRHGGLGIGLSIAKRLIEMHDGTIRAESDGPGKGSTFTVELPMAPAPTRPALAPVAPRPELKPESPAVIGIEDEVAEHSTPVAGLLSGTRVLIVDDHAETRRAISRLLQSLGAEVELAASTPSALAAARRAWPTVLLSDIGMPGQDGYDLIRTLRAEEADAAATNGHPRLHAIALTAFAMPEDREKALATGFDEYLPKPVNFADLLESVKRGTAGAVASC